MKPAEIYPKHPDTDAYYIGGSYTPYAIVAVDKRFSEAELAAEWWASHGDANALMTGNLPMLFSRRQVFKRMATLPHFDEADQ